MKKFDKNTVAHPSLKIYLKNIFKAFHNQNFRNKLKKIFSRKIKFKQKNVRPRFFAYLCVGKYKKRSLNSKQRKPKKHKTKKGDCSLLSTRSVSQGIKIFPLFTFFKHSVIFSFYLTSFTFITSTPMDG